jgi:hypothetical protein
MSENPWNEREELEEARRRAKYLGLIPTLPGQPRAVAPGPAWPSSPLRNLVIALIGTYGWWYALAAWFGAVRGFIQSSFKDPDWLQFFHKWNDLGGFFFIVVSCFVVFAYFCWLGWASFFRLTARTLAVLFVVAILCFSGAFAFAVFG